MELTSKSIRDVTFGAKVRGYDPAEVDEFIAAVADGYDELQERLRRAIDRATRAEAQLSGEPQAMAGATIDATPAATAAPTAAASPEISKVWERAVAAAESAIAEAKETAQQLLDAAHRDAEAHLTGAQSEAARISEDAQRSLRGDIARLEEAHEQLRNDSARLADSIENERERVRGVLSRALAVIDEVAPTPALLGDIKATPAPASAAFVEPASSPVVVPEEQPVVEQAYEEPNTEEPVDAVDDDGYESSPYVETQVEEEVFVEADNDNPIVAPSETPASAASWMEPQWQMNPVDVPAEGEPEQPPAPASQDQDESDQDPFLAELRRAVQDDQPLGPRDEKPEDDESSIDSLYSTDDEDEKKGFFPWKKQ